MNPKNIAKTTSILLVLIILYIALTNNLTSNKTPNPHDVLFKITGSHTGSTGGIGSESIGKEKLPDTIVVGRTWADSDGPWTDHSYKFKAYLLTGTRILVDLYATSPLQLKFSVDGRVLYDYDDVVMFSEIITIPVTGSYTISLRVDRGNTSTVNMTCKYVT